MLLRFLVSQRYARAAPGVTPAKEEEKQPTRRALFSSAAGEEQRWKVPRTKVSQKRFGKHLQMHLSLYGLHRQILGGGRHFGLKLFGNCKMQRQNEVAEPASIF